MMRSLVLTLLLACDELEGTPPLQVEAEVLPDVLELSDPEPFVELVDNPRAFIPVEDGCPSIEVDGALETWTGGCALSDGTLIEGSLSRYDSEDGAWIAASAFAVRAATETVFALDGAIEVQSEGALLFVDAAAESCGLGDMACEDGPATVDLAFTLYPLSTWPYAYDATLSGVIALPGRPPADVGASWTQDAARCGAEPTSGLFAVRDEVYHTLEWDGAERCDACATWMVQGVETGQLCGLPSAW